MRRIIHFALLLGVMLNAHAQTVVLLDGPVKITAEARPVAKNDGITLRGAYFFNSLLATYTKRGEALMRVRTYARSALCNGAGDGASDGVRKCK